MSVFLQRPGNVDPTGAARNTVPAALMPARARFCNLIVQRILAFEAFRVNSATDADPRPASAAIAALAHKIAGVGETLGFSRVGQLAATLEQCTRDGLSRHIPPRELSRDVDPLLDALLDELERLPES